MKDLLGNFDIMLINLSSGISCGVSIATELLINMVASLMFRWELLYLGLVTTACVIFYSMVMLFCSIGHGKKIFYFYVMCFLVPCGTMALLPFASKYSGVHSGEILAIQTVIIAALVLVNIFAGVSATMFARKLLFDLVPSHSVCFAEGVRNMFSRSISLLGFFTASFMYPVLGISMPIIIVIYMLIIVCLIARKKQLTQCYQKM